MVLITNKGLKLALKTLKRLKKDNNLKEYRVLNNMLKIDFKLTLI